MSLFKNSLFLLFAILILNGCGYQPLYGKQQTQRATIVQQDLSNIWILEIPQRGGQLLHNELLTLFNTRGKPKKPQFILKVSYTESKRSLGIQRDEFATRANLNVSAQYSLTGDLKLNGSSQSVVSYNILTSPTGTEFAERNALERAMKAIAVDIYRKVAVQIKNKPADN